MSLTVREQQVIDFIRSYRQHQARLPSARQISSSCGFKSSRSAQNYIDSLKAKGLLYHRRPETCSYVLPDDLGSDGSGGDVIPVLGTIAAGSPVAAFDDCDKAVRIPAGFFGKSQELFALQIMGNSMSGDHICEGDIAIIRREQGEFTPDAILAVRVGSDEFTLKRVKTHQSGAVELVSSNPEFPTIAVGSERIHIAGRYVGLLRRS